MTVLVDLAGSVVHRFLGMCLHLQHASHWQSAAHTADAFAVALATCATGESAYPHSDLGRLMTSGMVQLHLLVSGVTLQPMLAGSSCSCYSCWCCSMLDCKDQMGTGGQLWAEHTHIAMAPAALTKQTSRDKQARSHAACTWQLRTGSREEVLQYASSRVGYGTSFVAFTKL